MFRVLLLSLAVAARILAQNITEEDDIWILDTTNFEGAVNENDFVLVEFYAPWCSHCKTLAAELSKAAKQLKEEGSSIRLAKVDATTELRLANKFQIREYPTLKFFKHGSLFEYEGGHTSDSLVNWLKKKTGPAAKQLNDKDSANDLKKEADVAVIGFFKDQESDVAKEFLKVADEFDDVPFGITSISDVFTDNNVEKDGIVLFKKFDEGRNDFDGELNEKDIKSFILLNQLPLAIEFTQDTVRKIFAGEVKHHLLLFLKKEGSDNIIKEYTEVAREFKGKMLFLFLDSVNDDNIRIMEFFGLKENSGPALRIVNVENEMAKYHPTTEGVDTAAIRKFVQNYLDGKLKPHLMSQDISEDWDSKPVKVLVGKNFKDIAFNKKKAVFVTFYAPWCEHSQHLAPIWDELGELYKDNDSIVIAKVDATANEVEGFKIKSFPTIKYFPLGSDESIDYTGERTLEALIKFLDSNGKESVAVEEEKKDEEQEKKAAKEKIEL